MGGQPQTGSFRSTQPGDPNPSVRLCFFSLNESLKADDWHQAWCADSLLCRPCWRVGRSRCQEPALRGRGHCHQCLLPCPSLARAVGVCVLCRPWCSQPVHWAPAHGHSCPHAQTAHTFTCTVSHVHARWGAGRPREVAGSRAGAGTSCLPDPSPHPSTSLLSIRRARCRGGGWRWLRAGQGAPSCHASEQELRVQIAGSLGVCGDMEWLYFFESAVSV